MLLLFTRQPTQFMEMPLWNWSRAGRAPPPHRICQANFWFQLIYCNKLRGGVGVYTMQSSWSLFSKGVICMVYMEKRPHSLPVWVIPDEISNFWECKPHFFLKNTRSGSLFSSGVGVGGGKEWRYRWKTNPFLGSHLCLKAKFWNFVFDGGGEVFKKRQGEFMTKCNWNIWLWFKLFQL